MRTALVAALLLLCTTVTHAVIQRFPKPDFESGYERPALQTPAPRSMALESLDVLVLAAALSLASYYALVKRSRRHLFVLMLFSLVYFGFWRKGCVCSIGSLQNVAYVLSGGDYAIPLTAVAFFVLPLVFTLFFGRTFCAAVCPLGAVQDAVILRPVKVPAPLAHGLSMIPYVYLGLAALFAATGAGFLICRYDPFVGFFRLGASFNMVLFGAFMLLLGTTVARPYCRFICPYGVLLNWMSRLSRRHLTITPSECVNCRLCEESCPFDAIRRPAPQGEPEPRGRGLRRLVWLFAVAPIIILSAAWLGSRLGAPLSSGHFTVALAAEIRGEENGLRTETTEETRAFRATGTPMERLYSDARQIQNRFRTGGWILGAFLGLVLCVKLIALSIRPRQQDYTADNGNCLSCGRCFAYCPVGVGDVPVSELRRLYS